MKRSYALLALALGAAGTHTSARNFVIGTTNPGFDLSVVSDGQGGGHPDDLSVESFNTIPCATVFIRSGHGSQASPSNLSAGIG